MDLKDVMPQGRAATLVDVLRARAELEPDREAFSFLRYGRTDRPEALTLSYSGLLARAKEVASVLQQHCVCGDRVLILAPPGLDYVAAIWGCQFAGAVAVPAYPPRNVQRLDRLVKIEQDCGAKVLLTVEALLGKSSRLSLRKMLHAIAVDRLPQGGESAWKDPNVRPENLAFLQYTSGTTGSAKGVMVGHDNLMANFEAVRRRCGYSENDVQVSWLPPYHDLGLVAGILQPVFFGVPTVGMAPEAFLQDPYRWLRAISDFGGSLSAAPNFAYELCCATGNNAADDTLNLSTWRIAGSGGEPPRAATLERFSNCFAKRGFKRSAFCPAFGMAETTLQVTNGQVGAGPRIADLKIPDSLGYRTTAVSNGAPLDGHDIKIVDPKSLLELPVGTIGEIWIAGPTVAHGYWKQPELNAFCFGGRLAKDSEAGPFLRTGDLGVLLDGELFVVGRIKELVILRGRNIYPQDVEAAVSAAHPELVSDRSIAFGVERGGVEQLIIVHEIGRHVASRVEAPLLYAAIRRSVIEAIDVNPDEIVLVKSATLPRTTSGKLQRLETRARFLEDRLAIIARWSAHDVVMPDNSAGCELQPDAASASFGIRGEALIHYLAEMVRAFLGLSETPDEHVHFTALGLDSLSAVKLSVAISTYLKMDPPLPAAALFENATLADLAKTIEAQLEHEVAGVSSNSSYELGSPSVRPSPDDAYKPFALTEVQQAYYLGRQDVGSIGDVSCFAFVALRVPDLDPVRLEEALNRLVAAQPMLRTVFAPNLTQQTLPEVPRYAIAVHDLSAAGRESAEAAWRKLVDTLSHRVLPADQWPLFELHSAIMPDGETRLCFGIDLLIADAASIGLITSELFGLYYGDIEAPHRSSLSFRDVVVWREGMRQGPGRARAEAYWQARITELPGVPALPLANLREGTSETRFVRRQQRMPTAAWIEFQHLARKAGVTPSAALVAAYTAVLGTWSESDDFVVQMTVMDRPQLHPEIGCQVGDFTAISLLEVRAARLGRFVDRAKAIQRRMLADIEHLEFSGMEVLRELAQQTGQAVQEQVVFTSMLGADALASGVSVLDRHGIEVMEAVSQTPQVLLDCQVYEASGELCISWDAPEAMYPDGLLDDMFQAYCAHLEALAFDATAWEGNAPVSMPIWQQRLIASANATAGLVPSGRLESGFFEMAVNMPDRPALLGIANVPGASMSYGALADRVRRLTARLVEMLDEDEPVVAIVMNKGWEQVAAALAVLAAGRAFIPVALDQPAARLKRILDDAGVRLVVTTPDVEVKLDFLRDERRVLAVSEEALFDGHGQKNLRTAAATSPEALAYVIYTSGSTGQPKGVMVSHAAAMNTLLDMRERLAIEPEDRILWVSELAFDLSIFDLFGVLGAGGAVVLPNVGPREDPRLWLEAIQRHSVTLWNSVPALAELMLNAAGTEEASQLTTLRAMLLSGDWIPMKLPDRVRALSPHCDVVGLGGATEAAIWSILYSIGPIDRDWRSIPYGKPLRNQTFHVLKSDFSRCPVHVPGKLFIGGLGLADGYWNDPEMSALKFVHHPLSGERLYDTGDLGRYLPSGDIEFLGREDFQVKIRGVRVELGEIQSALLEHPRIESAVACDVRERNRRRIVAYVVPSSGSERLGPAACGVLHDPLARAAFLLEQHNKLSDQSDVEPLPLPGKEFDSAWRAKFLARQSYRRFGGTAPDKTTIEAWLAAGTQELPPFSSHQVAESDLRSEIDLEQLGHLLRAVQAMPVEGVVVPKRLYGSAGGAYPVRTFIDVGYGALAGIEAGRYAYDPITHSLHQQTAYCSDPKFEPGVVISLVGHLPAIQPLYGTWSLQACALEAGQMWSVLATHASSFGMELTSTSTYQELKARQARFGLGAPDDNPLLVALQLHLASRELTRKPIQSQEVLVQVKDCEVDGLDRGVYTFDKSSQRLVPRHLRGLSKQCFEGENVGIYEPAGLIVALSPQTDGLSRTEEEQIRGLIEAGWVGQRLGETGPEKGIGVCAVGGVAPDALRSAYGIEYDATKATHLLLSGWITPEQSTKWAPVGLHPFSTSNPYGLRDWVAARLPETMLPASFVVLDRLPLTSNGKVDRHALPKPEPTSGREYVAPQNEIEALFCQLMAKATGAAVVGTDDSFFDLGGDSIAATQLVARARDAGMMLTLRDVFALQSPGALALSVAERSAAALSNANSDLEELFEDGPVLGEGKHAGATLAPAEARLLLLESLNPGAEGLTSSATFRLRGPIDFGLLKHSMACVVARHDILRTRYVRDPADGSFRSEVLPASAFRIEEHPAAGLDAGSVEHLARNQADRPVDPFADIPLRAAIFFVSSGEAFLVLRMHHVAIDALSFAQLWHEISVVFNAPASGNEPQLPPALQYRDYAVWSRRRMTAKRQEQLRQHWRRRLAGAPNCINLPFDRSRPPSLSDRTGTVSRQLSQPLVAAIHELCKEYQLTKFVVLETTLALLCARLTKAQDIVVGTVSAGRNHPALRPAIGCFVNTVPLRHEVKQDSTALKNLQAARAEVLSAVAHDDLEFHEIVDAINPQRSSSHDPLFQVFCQLRDAPVQNEGFLGAAAVERLPNKDSGRGADLSYVFEVSRNGRISADIIYAADLFEATSVEAIHELFVALAWNVVTRPEDTVEALFDLSVAEARASVGPARIDSLLGTAKEQSGTGAWYPLTAVQRDLWLAEQKAPQGTSFHSLAVLECPPGVNLEQLEAALVGNITQQDTAWLRLSPEGLQQSLTCNAVPELHRFNCSSWDEGDEGPKSVLNWFHQLPADRNVSAHFAVFESPKSVVVAASSHHLWNDGWGILKAIERVCQDYRRLGEDPEHHVVIKERFLDSLAVDQLYRWSDPYEADEAFWRALSKEVQFEPMVELLASRRSATNLVARSRSIRRSVSTNTLARIKTTAKDLSLSHSELVTGLVGLYLARLVPGRDVLISVPYANRTPATIRAPGHFANVLPLNLTSAVAAASVGDALQQVAAAFRAAMRHGRYPFGEMVRRCRLNPLHGDVSVNVLFYRRDLKMDGRAARLRWLAGPERGLSFLVTQFGKSASAELELRFNEAIFNEALIARHADRLLKYFDCALDALTVQPRSLPILTEQEREAEIAEFNLTTKHLPEKATVLGLLEAQLARTPEAVALVFDQRETTYAELHDSANRLARALIARGLGPGAVIGVCLPRSADMVVAILGVLKAGAAYLPLDPEHPVARRAWMLSDSSAALVVCDSSIAADFSDVSHAACVTSALCLDEPAVKSELEGLPGNKLSDAERTSVLHPRHVAYIIYTSGTTGTPKGVIGEHSGLKNRILWLAEFRPINLGEVVVARSSIGFIDGSTEIFQALSEGAVLHILPSAVASNPRSVAVAVAVSGAKRVVAVPDFLEPLADNDESGANKVTWITSGAPLPGQLATSVIGANPEMEVVNLYGMTEAAGDSLVFALRSDDLDDSLTTTIVPIGHPISNTQVYVLDDRLEPVPRGVVGELWIAGVGLARGYLGRPALTAERFLACPFGPPGARMYRTGDLARRRADGTIEYHGRADQQVKIRGVRVEPSEVEAALLASAPDLVSKAAVTEKSGPNDSRQLVAYLVPRHGAALPPPEKLRRSMRLLLPEAMVPSAFVTLAQLPTTPNGKLDRLALPEPDMSSNRAFVAPQNEMEKLVCQLFSDVTGAAQVGVEDNFFELGGNSLSAMRLIAELLSTTGSEFDLRGLFEHPTPVEIAALLESGNCTPKAAFDIGHETAELVSKDLEFQSFSAAALVKRKSLRVQPPKCVLLTGATGFIGGYLASEIIDRSDANIVCLVRADDDEEAHSRLSVALASGGRPRAAAQIGKRIEVFAGQLGQPDLGLGSHQFNALSTKVDTILHNASEVNLLYGYPQLRSSNVVGTQSLLSLAAKRDDMRFHYVSTTSVFDTKSSDAHSLAMEAEPPNEVDGFGTGYAQSKWVAEWNVRKAGGLGMATTIYRPGRVVGDSVTGYWAAGDQTTRLLRLIARTGSAPDVEATLDATPVDYVAAAIGAIVCSPAADGKTMHLVSSKRIKLSSILDAMSSAGFSIERLPVPIWRERIATFVRDAPDDPATAIAPLVLGPYAERALYQVEALFGEREFSDQEARQLLAPHGINCPIASSGTLLRYFERLRADGYL